MPIQTLEKLERTQYFRGLFIGPPGRGKTIAACSFPGKTLVIDVDNRYTPLLDFYPERLGELNRLPIDKTNVIKELMPALSDLNNYINGYQTIVLDGITTLSTAVVMAIMDFNQGGDPRKNVKGNKLFGGGIIIPSWDEFNGEATFISNLLECLKSLPCNLIVTGHPVGKTSMTGKTWESIVTFGTKLDKMIPAYFDNIFYFDYSWEFDAKNNPVLQRMVYTGPSQDYPDAKNAYKDIPYKIDVTSPSRTYVKGSGLYEKIEKYIKSSTPVLK